MSIVVVTIVGVAVAVVDVACFAVVLAVVPTVALAVAVVGRCGRGCGLSDPNRRPQQAQQPQQQLKSQTSGL